MAALSEECKTSWLGGFASITIAKTILGRQIFPGMSQFQNTARQLALFNTVDYECVYHYKESIILHGENLEDGLCLGVAMMIMNGRCRAILCIILNVFVYVAFPCVSEEIVTNSISSSQLNVLWGDPVPPEKNLKKGTHEWHSSATRLRTVLALECLQ